jgi:biotin carboxyl carrier protein
MKVYKIKVNGTVYEVQLESVTENAETIKVEKTENVKAPETNERVAGEKILAPMQGNILRVDVAVGQTVKKGQCLLILEAMKMENEILAPVAGKVLKVSVNKGQTVNTNDLLVVIGQ